MRLILNKHRNALLELIREAKLDPQAFHPTEEITEKDESFHLELLGTPHYFFVKATLTGDKRVFWYKYSTFRIAYPNPIIGEDTSLFWWDFDRIEVEFKNWLHTVTKYLNHLKEEEEDRMLPDLWSELALPPSSSSSLLRLQNTPFTKDEQARISESLHE